MKRLLQGLFAGAALAVIGTVAAAPITGPQDTGSLFSYLNNYILQWVTLNANGGELQLLGPGAFAANGTTATAMSSVGPLNAHTTVQRWLVVMTPGGVQGFVPVF